MVIAHAFELTRLSVQLKTMFRRIGYRANTETCVDFVNKFPFFL